MDKEKLDIILDTVAETSEWASAESENIEVYGARIHNLKNIDILIPRNKLVVITGISGSGKSSLAFDTIYAEGQRRYLETFSAYARQFIGTLERPDVDKINGLSPVISIEQKTTIRNPRSTVGTITEIYDFLRLLYARASDAYSYLSGEKMVRYSQTRIIQLILDKYNNKHIMLLSPIVRGRKGHYRDLFHDLQRQGFLKVRIDGELRDIVYNMKLDRYKTHDIEVMIDMFRVNADVVSRLNSSINTAMHHSNGLVAILDNDNSQVQFYSRNLICPITGISYSEPEPNNFSFNSAYGACPKCSGLGSIQSIDIDKVIPDRKVSIHKGAIKPLGEYKPTWIFRQIEALADKYGFSLNDPVSTIPDNALNAILYGTDEVLKVKNDIQGNSLSYSMSFEGIISFLSKQMEERNSDSLSKWFEGFLNYTQCPECQGQRLKKESLHFKILDQNISQVAGLDLIKLRQWIDSLNLLLDNKRKIIAGEIIREIKMRIDFMIEVGLDYLTIDRATRTLSGGESQRIRLATQIGSQLTGVLYLLDEPTIGLHQRDNLKVIHALRKLRDIGNSVIVVEHDREMIEAADYIIDIGPGAGSHGGKITAAGTLKEIIKTDNLTADYLNHKKTVVIPEKSRKGTGKFLTLTGATGNNLKNVTISLPLGKMICITGVSGSGKSTLINETLYPILSGHFYRSHQKPLPYTSIQGIENIDKVIEIDQSPIGRTPRSNPATYTSIFTHIRDLFTLLPEAKIRGYKPGRFSFNIKGGRCETCKGAGLKVIEMNFLPDVHIICDDCNGKRYNRETLEIRYKGQSINDVLNLTIEQAAEFFQNIPRIHHKLQTLIDIGLTYVTLGQASTTLSGGEAQRIKLAAELSKRDTGKTLYILDEPTTGLHFHDVNILLLALNRLADKGNSVLIIEHNIDVIKQADHIIELGPDAGERGGEIVFTGTPAQLAKHPTAHTASFLK